jgi:thiol-disulfide isomerase/thioredoxin
MSKKYWIVLIPLLILSCNFLFPARTPIVPTTQPATIPPSATAPMADPTEPVPATPEAQAEPPAHVVIRLFRADGHLEAQIAEHAQKARDLGLALFIEFDATWCPPCQAIEESLQEENPLMMDAIQGVYLLRADADDWGWDNPGLSFEAIPVYFKLDEDGQPTGDIVDGGAWGENIPENFAPVLDEFFHGLE